MVGPVAARSRTAPVRTFGDSGDPASGHVETRFAAYGGASTAGAFVQTLVLTDVATGWTGCAPVAVRGAGLVAEALRTRRWRAGVGRKGSR